MPSLAELAGQQALTNAGTPGDNITQGLKAGLQVAGLQQNLEQQKSQLQEQQLDLQNKQSTAMSNMLQAASFSKDQRQRNILLDRVEAQANQIQVPFDRQAFQASLDDDTSRIAIQQGLKDVQSGKVAPSTFLETIASAPGLFQYVNSKSAESAKYLQQMELQDKKDEASLKKATTVAGIRAQAASSNGVSGSDIKLERLIQTEHNKIANDRVLTKLTDARNKLETGWNVLTTKSKLTNEEFNDLQIELGGAIAGGVTGVSEGKLSRTEYHTYQQDLARLVQKVTGKPQDSVPPQILAQFKELFQHVREANAKNTQERAKNLQRTSRIPEVQAAHDEALAPYLNMGSEDQTAAPATAAPKAPTDKRAALEALIGTVNPRTGKKITKADVEAQLAARGIK